MITISDVKEESVFLLSPQQMFDREGYSRDYQQSERKLATQDILQSSLGVWSISSFIQHNDEEKENDE